MSRPVTTSPRGCTPERQASFVRGRRHVRKDVDGRYEPSARLLLGAPAHRAWEVSADLVAHLHATPAGRKLIRYLASADAQRAWGAQQSGFSVHAGVPPAGGTGPDRRRSLARTLRDPGPCAASPPTRCRPRCGTRSPRRRSNSSPNGRRAGPAGRHKGAPAWAGERPCVTARRVLTAYARARGSVRA
ncbi:hypothetical protein ACWC2M_04095 [Streptomyces sp. NPDC001761]